MNPFIKKITEKSLERCIADTNKEHVKDYISDLSNMSSVHLSKALDDETARDGHSEQLDDIYDMLFQNALRSGRG